MGVLHRALALGMRCCEVLVSDVTLTVSQQDAPGPHTALGGPLEGRDALRLCVRQMLLLPELPAGVLGHTMCRQCGVMHIHRQGRQRRCAGTAGGEGSTGEGPARSPAGAVEALRTPAQLLAWVTAAAPAGLSVQVTGLSLSLLSYDARRPAQAQPSAPAGPAAAAAAAAAPGPSSGAGVFTAGAAPPGSRGGAGAQPTVQPFRQRKRFRASGGGEPVGSSEGRPATSAAAAGPSGAAALQDIPVEQHVLLQQWGFELTVRVPARGGQPQEQPKDGDSPARHQRIYTNPVYASEEASTSSTSDTGAASLQLWGNCT